MLQFLTTRRRARTQEATQKSRDDLFDAIVQGNFSTYDDILEILRTYPEEVISSCQDVLGNSILHIILCGNVVIMDTSDNLDNNYGISSTVLVHMNCLDKTKEHDTEANRQRKSCSILPLIHYLVQCSNAIERPHDHQESDNKKSISTTNNSLLRHQSAGGSLPLHLACRFYVSQQLDVVQYIIQAYPYALQCPDAWGHLPLHEACSNSCVALEVVLLLLQNYPNAAREPNKDGNLPLHLAAASRCTLRETDKRILSKDEYQLEIVQCLLCFWPEAIQYTNIEGKTALQMAKDFSNNVLVIEFLQSLSEPLVSPLLSNQKLSVVASQEVSGFPKVPINPFADDQLCKEQTFPDHQVSEPDAQFNMVSDNDFCNNRETLDNNGTLSVDDALLPDERGFKTLKGMEPGDESEVLCVELVEDFQIVVNKGWSENGPYWTGECKETEY